MKVEVDEPRCEGHGLCVGQAPEVFALDYDGDLVHAFAGRTIPDGLESSARSAIASCPVAALREIP